MGMVKVVELKVFVLSVVAANVSVDTSAVMGWGDVVVGAAVVAGAAVVGATVGATVVETIGPLSDIVPNRRLLSKKKINTETKAEK